MTDPTETDEQRADRLETERDHARGDHTYCGVTCEAELPTEHLRNFVIAKGYPGTAGALDELLRRARAEAAAPVVPSADRAAVLREAADRLGRMDYDTDSNDYGYDTYRDAWNGGVMDGADLLRRVAAEAQPFEADRDSKTSPKADSKAQPTTKPEAQPEFCAHCGKTILRTSGTLAEWWVHDPGGHAMCFPQHAADSPRATPAVVSEPGKEA